MSLTQRIDQYFSSIRQRDIASLMALFAPDAVMFLPNGTELAGPEAIRGLFLRLFASQSPMPQPIVTFADRSGAASEIETQLPDGTLRRTANFYHFDSAGRIRRLSHYARGA